MDEHTDLITRMAGDLQALNLAAGRAADIAAELKRLCAVIRTTTDALSFDDEPAGYPALLTKAAPR